MLRSDAPGLRRRAVWSRCRPAGPKGRGGLPGLEVEAPAGGNAFSNAYVLIFNVRLGRLGCHRVRIRGEGRPTRREAVSGLRRGPLGVFLVWPRKPHGWTKMSLPPVVALLPFTVLATRVRSCHRYRCHRPRPAPCHSPGCLYRAILHVHRAIEGIDPPPRAVAPFAWLALTVELVSDRRLFALESRRPGRFRRS